MSSGCDVVVVGAGNAAMNAALAARERTAEVVVPGDRRIGDGSGVQRCRARRHRVQPQRAGREVDQGVAGVT